jgi:hypothetical protein
MRNRIVNTAPALIAALAVFPVLALVLRRGVDIPFWDEWEWLPLVYAAHHHTLTFADVWYPHNEHRIFVPTLLMLALDRLGGWSVVREQVVSVATLAATQLTMWLLIRRTVAMPLRGVTFLAATLLLFGFAQYENLEWGFQMAWFLCDLGMVVAVWALARPDRDGRAIAVAIAVATIASLSSSQGLAAWVAGTVVILLAPRLSRRVLAVWIGAAIVAVALARYGVRPIADSGGGIHAAAPHLIEYLLAYLGSPLAASFKSGFAIAAGGVLVLWLAALTAVAWRGPQPLRALLAPWLGIAAYVLACAALTAIGRGGNEFDQALSSRYTSIGSLAWIAAVVATVVCMQHVMVRRPLLLALPIVAALCLSFAQDDFGNAMWHKHAVEMRIANDRLSRGDVEGIAAVYPYPDRFMMLFGELSDIHDGVFSAP